MNLRKTLSQTAVAALLMVSTAEATEPWALDTAKAAEQPDWLRLAGQYADYTIKIDPAIIQDSRFQALLELERISAANALELLVFYVHEEVQNRTPGQKFDKAERGSAADDLKLVWLTNRYAVVYKSWHECFVWLLRCRSNDEVFLFDLEQKRRLDAGDILDLASNPTLVMTLVERDRNRQVFDARSLARATSSDGPADAPNVQALLPEIRRGPDTLGQHKSIDATRIQKAVQGIGFSLGPDGRVVSLDLYFNGGNVGDNYHLRGWPIDIADAAALLKPDFRDLPFERTTKPIRP